MHKKIILIYFLFLGYNLFAQLRTFNDIFPRVSVTARNEAFSQDGYISYSRTASLNTLLGGNTSGIPYQITNNILNKSPGYCIETILVIPCSSSTLTITDIYNALGNIRNIRGRSYESYNRRQPTPLFEEATRITSQNNTTAIPDPSPVSRVPASETFYVRLKDVNFGNTFYRGNVFPVQNGLGYSLTNFRAISYFLLTIIRAEKFNVQLYIEPVQEGILIYCIAGVDISDFIANQINVNSAISKRLRVIIDWAQDEILTKVNR